jgi:hypothetical protein
MNLKKIMTVAAFSFVLASCTLPTLEEYETKLVDAGYTVEIVSTDDEVAGAFLKLLNIKEQLSATKGSSINDLESGSISVMDTAGDAEEYYETIKDLYKNVTLDYFIAKNGTYLYSSNSVDFFEAIGVTYEKI